MLYNQASKIAYGYKNVPMMNMDDAVYLSVEETSKMNLDN